MRSIGAKTSLTKSMAGNLINLLQNMGADNELPAGKADRVGWLNQFHKNVAVNNPYWPNDLPFGYVYGAFALALLYGGVELKGHNTRAFTSAFKRWITQEGIKDRLYTQYYRDNPNQAPKQLKSRNKETNQTKQAEAKGYVDFSPDVVQSQIQILETIWDTAEEVIKAFPGAESYAMRLYATRGKMIDYGDWPA